MSDEPVAIVMAAGKGTRMESDLPKVLVPVCGRPMVAWVIDALAAAGVHRVLLVVGYRREDVIATFRDVPGVDFVVQDPQNGTGHAVMMCRPKLTDQRGPVFVVTGDSPLLQPSSVRKLLTRFATERPACILGTAHKSDPGSLGRIVRDGAGQFVRIVEFKDATEDQRRSLTECNMSTYVFDGPELLAALAQLRNDNAQQEYYITDCCGILRDQGKKVLAVPELEPCEALSINNLADLAEVEKVMQQIGASRKSEVGGRKADQGS